MVDNVQIPENLNFDKVWLMFQETDRKFQETDRKFQETDRKFQETKELLAKVSMESEKKLKKLERLFTGHWGKLIESLVKGDLVKLLRAKGINVY